MLSDKTWLLFYGTIVTTHRIEAYGGTRLPRGFLDQLATQINERGLPLSQNHDPSKRLRASDFRATVVEREDGEFSLDFEAKVHPDDAQVLAKTPGLSITLTTPLDGEKDTGRADLTILGNTAWFPDDALAEARDVLAGSVGDAKALRLYEYSFLPDPNLLIEMTLDACTLLGGGSVLWGAVRAALRGRRKLEGRETVPTRITTTIVGNQKSANVTVETLDEGVAERAFQSFDAAVDKLFQSPESAARVVWHDEEQRWQDF